MGSFSRAGKRKSGKSSVDRLRNMENDSELANLHRVHSKMIHLTELVSKRAVAFFKETPNGKFDVAAVLATYNQQLKYSLNDELLSMVLEKLEEDYNLI